MVEAPGLDLALAEELTALPFPVWAPGSVRLTPDSWSSPSPPSASLPVTALSNSSTPPVKFVAIGADENELLPTFFSGKETSDVGVVLDWYGSGVRLNI